jgi:alginate O-acetyltransferase complex protein AlgI
LWHGANWTFVIWGALHGALLAINHFWRRLGIAMPTLVCWALTFLTATIAWIFFRAATFGRAWAILRAAAGLNGIALGTRYESLSGHQFVRILIGLAIVLLAPNRQTIMEWEWASDYLYAGVFAVLTTVCLLSMANPPAFIYFQF